VTRLERLLLLLVLALMAADIAGVLALGVGIDGPAYGRVALLVAALLAGAIFYRIVRPAPPLAAMLAGCAFLCAFSAAGAMLNYLLLPVAGPRIDVMLAGWDRALGFSWPMAAAWAADHRLAAAILLLAYGTMLPQVALLLLVLARRPQNQRAHIFCLAIALGALFCVAIWTLRPSFGAFSVYVLDPAVASRFHPALGPDYARALTALLAQGPSFLSPGEMKGLIGFPSYHVVMALIVTRFAWPLRALRWPVLVLNLLVVISAPVEGGHHLVDVLAAFPVAWAALALARRAAAPSRTQDLAGGIRPADAALPAA
jgi:hypothetical protein